MQSPIVRLSTWITLTLAACGNQTTDVASCCASAPAATAPLPGNSLYQLEVAGRDQTGAIRRLADGRGGPVLVSMIFTHCAYACPTIAADVSAILAKRPDRKDLQVLLVSMDPARDDPAALAAFAARHGLAADRCTLLTTTADGVRDVAAALGVRYAPTANGDFSHSNVVTLLDRDGAIAARIEGLGIDPAPLLAALDRIPNRPPAR